MLSDSKNIDNYTIKLYNINIINSTGIAMRKLRHYFLLYVPALLFLLIAAFLTFYLTDFSKSFRKESESEYVFCETQDVPVLLYHHIDKVGKGDSTISLKHFKRQMNLLKEAGYNTVTVSELADYVYGIAPLPENPICITFDDGYKSNYTLAFPFLCENEMKATIFAIGCSFGKSSYKDTGIPIIPHFSYEEAKEMVSSGLIEIQSHTYDMHQSYDISGEGARAYAVPHTTEQINDFKTLFKKDFKTYDDEYFSHFSKHITSFSYPHGISSDITEKILAECGVISTFTTRSNGKNTLKLNSPESLKKMYRITVTESMSDDAFMRAITDIYGIPENKPGDVKIEN